MLGEGNAKPRIRSYPRAFIALTAVIALLATACGSRLSDAERAAVLGALTTGQAGDGQAIDLDFEELEADEGADQTGGGAVGGVGAEAGDGGAAVGGPQVAQAAECPPATRGTDTGLTANRVTIATLADISGVQPGLFQAAHQGARAAAAYINSQGGICGRQIDPMLLDSRTDAGGNRSAMLEACDKAFAVVGSMSAFDDGSAAPGEQCGIPDMTAVTTNVSKYNASNVFPVYPQGPVATANTSARYIAQRHPDVIKKAGILWLNQAVTKANADTRKKAWESVGFEFIYQQEVQVLEANFSRFVIDMRNQDVQYVTMVADHQNLVRLQRAMRQQGFVPKVRDWDSVAYDPKYLTERDAVEGSFVFMNTAMFEEADENPEMQLYIQWLQRVAPGATPNYFGIYAWSGYRLFQKLASEVGPDLTRPQVLEALRGTQEWNGHGLHGPHQIGAKLPTVCNLYLEVRGGRFARMAPASGFDCGGSLVR